MSALQAQLEGSVAIERAKAGGIEVTPTPMGMLQLAISKGADIDQLTKLMELQERFEANEARKAFNVAMAKFKENPPKINKNKSVAFGKGDSATSYKHATLDHVTDQITAALSAVGISHKWAVDQKEQIAVTCILTHQMGHSESTTLRAAPDSSGSKNPIQAIGSAVTYLERYTLLAATGMAAVGTDTDGNVAKSEDMDPDNLKRVLSIIANSPDLAELKKNYISALKTGSGDRHAMDEIEEVKNRRKEELS